MPTTKCPSCVGGKQTTTITEWGSNKPPESYQMNCFRCKGTGFIDSQTAATIEYEKNMWCKCKGSDPRNARYYKDNEHPKISKHHYRCRVCGKVIQIG